MSEYILGKELIELVSLADFELFTVATMSPPLLKSGNRLLRPYINNLPTTWERLANGLGSVDEREEHIEYLKGCFFDIDKLPDEYRLRIYRHRRPIVKNGDSGAMNRTREMFLNWAASAARKIKQEHDKIPSRIPSKRKKQQIWDNACDANIRSRQARQEDQSDLPSQPERTVEDIILSAAGEVETLWGQIKEGIPEGMSNIADPADRIKPAAFDCWQAGKWEWLNETVLNINYVFTMKKERRDSGMCQQL